MRVTVQNHAGVVVAHLQSSAATFIVGLRDLVPSTVDAVISHVLSRCAIVRFAMQHVDPYGKGHRGYYEVPAQTFVSLVMESVGQECAFVYN